MVYGHLLCDYADEQASSPVCITIYSFHMALFMSLSGYFFQSSLKKSFTEVLKSKAVQLLIPLIAGISYELIRLAGRSEGKIIGLLSKPGMMLQKLTTREPDDDMIEVGIASVEAVFDWKKWQKEENV